MFGTALLLLILISFVAPRPRLPTPSYSPPTCSPCRQLHGCRRQVKLARGHDPDVSLSHACRNVLVLSWCVYLSFGSTHIPRANSPCLFRRAGHTVQRVDLLDDIFPYAICTSQPRPQLDIWIVILSVFMFAAVYPVHVVIPGRGQIWTQRSFNSLLTTIHTIASNITGPFIKQLLYPYTRVHRK